MKTLKFFAPFLVVVLLMVSCGKEEAVVNPSMSTEDIFSKVNDLNEFQLEKVEIDQVLMNEYGYIETDHEKRAAQLFDVVTKQLQSNNVAVNNENAGTRNECLLSELPDIISVNGGTFRGTVCEEDLLLNALVYGVFSNGGEVLAVDGEVFNVGEETVADAFVKKFGPDGATLLFGATRGTISTLEGSFGDVVIGKQFNRNNLFCNPDDFGDGLRLQARSLIINSPAGNGSMDYSISLSIICKD